MDLAPLLVPAMLKLGKTAFRITLKDGKVFQFGTGLAKALKEAESLATLEARIAKIEQAAAAEGTILTPELRTAIVRSKYISGLIRKGNTSAKLAENLIAAEKLKPGIAFQAHHDLPQMFREFFASHGLDIDKADYGRWVNGANGWHASWSSIFNDEWKRFIDAEWECFRRTGKYYSVNDILAQMEKLRKDLRFAPNPPIH